MKKLEAQILASELAGGQTTTEYAIVIILVLTLAMTLLTGSYRLLFPAAPLPA